MLILSFVLCIAGCAKSAERVGEREFIVEDEKYIAISIGFTEEGKTVAKADGFDIMEIPEDKEHTFLAVRSRLDDWTIVKDSYEIPTSGKLNIAYCNHERITNGEKLCMVQSILDENYKSSIVIKTNAEPDIYNATKDIYVGYEDCPVGTDRIGAIGNINGHLVFIKTEDLKNGDLQYTCYILNDEYQDLYANSVQRTFDTVNLN